MRWTELTLDTLATAATQWHITTLSDTVDPLVFTSLVHRAIRRGSVLCETKDSFGDPIRLLVLRVPGPEGSIAGVAFTPEQVRHDNTWILALTPNDPTGDWPALPPGPLVLNLTDREWALRVGEAELAVTLRWSKNLRDWAWAWPRTIGPATLNVIVDATSAEIDAWFTGHASRYYAHTSTDMWGRRFESKLSKDSSMRLYDRTIMFLRGYHASPPRQRAADQVLLADLIAGALPVVGFDVIDGDYMVTCATGFSAQSLHAYLRASRRFTSERAHPWKKGLERLTVDAMQAANEAEVEAAIERALQAFTRFTLPLEELLRTAPLEALPRAITVEHKGEITVAGLAARMPPLRARLQWRWAAAFEKATRTSYSG